MLVLGSVMLLPIIVIPIIMLFVYLVKLWIIFLSVVKTLVIVSSGLSCGIFTMFIRLINFIMNLIHSMGKEKIG